MQGKSNPCSCCWKFCLLILPIIFFFPFAAHAGTIYPMGNALSFDGNDDWVDCTGNGGNKQSAAALGLPVREITLEAWVKPRAYSKWKSMVAFFQDNGPNEFGWDLELRDGNKFGFALHSTSSAVLTYLETANAFLTDQWYHVAGAYDGGTMKIYVNGVLENTSNAQAGDIGYADSWLSIGQYKDDDESGTINGDIDEVRIWNVARSREQILSTMNESLTGNEPGLVAYYNFNEGVGGGNNTGLTTLPDLTRNGHDGQLNNFAGLDGSLGDGLISNWVPSEVIAPYIFVPTLSQWGVIIFAVLLGLLSIRLMKRLPQSRD